MERIKNKYLLSVLSGVLLFLSFPYTGSFTPLIFIALVPLLLIENELTSTPKSFFKSFKFSWISFLIYNLGSTWWIWNASEGGAIFAIVLNAILMALFFSIYHYLNKKSKSTFSVFFLIPVWISFEYFHYHWELSWPWLNFGNVFSITPKWVQWYEYIGVLGGTFWVLLVNVLVFKVLLNYQDLKKLNKKILIALGFVIFLPLIFSHLRYYTYKEQKDPLKVIALQPNIDPYNEKFSTSVESQVATLFRLADSKMSRDVDLIVAPETALSSNFWENNFEQTNLNYIIQSKVKEWNTPFLTGAATLKFYPEKNSNVARKLSDGPGFYESYNTSMLFKFGKSPEYIHKSKLVLGVEKIPFNTIFPFLEDLALNFGGASGSLGIEDSVKIFSTSNYKVASTVCYESVYGSFVAQQVNKGAQFIAIITNDGWWGNTPGYKQHASFARLRAIENRRSVVRSANTGTSCFINQRGDIYEDTDYWVEDVIAGDLNLNSKKTIYSSIQDWIGYVSVFMVVVLILFQLQKNLYHKKRVSKTN
jgi:apolipoprotein N-acyltransferase